MRAELTRSKRAGPYPDRWPIAYRTFHCYNPDCPEGRWPDGTPRFHGAGHFDRNGMCKHRHRHDEGATDATR